MQSFSTTDFDLKKSIECGQFFRYYLKDGWYYISIRECFFRIKQVEDKVYYEGIKYKAGKDKYNIKEDLVKNFFSLDEDYENILNSLKTDEDMTTILNKHRGLRLIRQDPWECLIGYIASQASNIPKHTKCLFNLSKMLGKPQKLNGEISYTFPIPGTLDNETMIRKAGLGFRAKYIVSANYLFGDQSLNDLRKSSYQKSKEELIKVYGISDKIANCVLLYSLGFHEAFPIDVWLKRIVEKKYFKGKKTSIQNLQSFSEDYFGEYAGYAQLFLYANR
jgi:N-glycosylase/DNA lyase